ncbi:MAG: glycosyltransferase family 4 protein [Bacteroidota bacterium]
MKYKIKIFLYAHINNIGAFNLNCRTIAKYIDKERFEVYTLSLSSGNLDTPNFKGVKIFNCFYPAKISNYLGILWGIYNCDVAYIARSNNFKFVHFLIQIFKKKSIKRQGNILDNVAYRAHLNITGNERLISYLYNFHNEVYAPTDFVGKFNNKHHKIKYNDQLYLPPLIDTQHFKRKSTFANKIQNVIFIGNDMIRKNIDEYFQLAKIFPNLQFHIVGSGLGKEGIDSKIKDFKVKNIFYHGLLSPNKLRGLLEEIDLHILPSKSEGFGKVTIETALVGIPSIIYNTYGASEWLFNEKEGFIVSSFEEMVNRLETLLNNPDLYKTLVEGTLSLSDRFEVTKRIKNYELAFKNLIDA